METIVCNPYPIENPHGPGGSGQDAGDECTSQNKPDHTQLMPEVNEVFQKLKNEWLSYIKEKSDES